MLHTRPAQEAAVDKGVKQTLQHFRKLDHLLGQTQHSAGLSFTDASCPEQELAISYFLRVFAPLSEGSKGCENRKR